jgi:hypothetical protein
MHSYYIGVIMGFSMYFRNITIHQAHTKPGKDWFFSMNINDNVLTGKVHAAIFDCSL